MNTLVMVELYKGRLGENLSCWRRYTSWLRSNTATHCLVSALTLYVCVSHPAVSNFLRPHGLQPTRLLCPWNSPGKNTGVGYHFLLQLILYTYINFMVYIKCQLSHFYAFCCWFLCLKCPPCIVLKWYLVSQVQEGCDVPSGENTSFRSALFGHEFQCSWPRVQC